MVKKHTYEELENRVHELEGVNYKLKQAEEALRGSEENLHTTLNSIGDAVIATDTQGNITRINPVAAKLTGWNVDAAQGKPLTDVFNIVNAQTRKRAVDPVSQVLENGKIAKLANHTMLIAKDGTQYQIADSAAPIQDEKGNTTGVVLVFRDVTEEYRIQHALRESEDRYRSLVENSLSAIILYRQEEILFANERFFDIFGYDPEELKSIVVDDVLAAETVGDIAELRRRRLAGEIEQTSVYESKGKRKDGEIFDMEISVCVAPYQDGPCCIASLSDISSRKKIEEELRESATKVRSIFRAAPAGIGVVSNRVFIEVNQRFCEITGYSEDELIGEKARIVYPTDEDFEFVGREKYRQIGEGGTGAVETRFKCKDGKIIDVLMSSTPLDPTDLSAGVTFTAFDITDRKRAEQALKESEEKYRLLFEMESDVIILVRRDDGRILEVNNAGTELYGYSRDELLEMKNTDLSAEPEATRQSAMEGRFRISLRYHRKRDGTVFPVEISGSQLNWKGQVARISTIRDISDRIEAEKEKAKYEEQLRHMQKMEAIGTLAGGIAHDFNNILGIMIGNTELAMDDMPNQNPAQSNLEEIKKAGFRAKDMIRQLLSFSRKTEQIKMPMKIAPIIKESFKFLRSSIPSSIEIRENISVSNDVISGDPTQIHQVIMNLCTNAAHAMEDEGGIMEIDLGNIRIDGTEAEQYQGLKPGPHVILSVSDTGCGIAPEISDRLFDPYFTTKEVDKGTGMGLAVVHGIVINYEGAISIKSEPGKGTTVSVLFPAVDNKTNDAPTASREVMPEGNERILFIDDEPSITKMCEQMLGRLGYVHETRSSPVEAFELFKSNPNRFDIIITDMTMPQITGDKLSEKILKLRPDIPVILCTGYSDRIDETQAKTIGISAMLYKPIVMRDMANVIRKVLDKTD